MLIFSPHILLAVALLFAGCPAKEHGFGK